jgi:hypothetical protein
MRILIRDPGWNKFGSGLPKSQVPFAFKFKGRLCFKFVTQKGWYFLFKDFFYFTKRNLPINQ